MGHISLAAALPCKTRLHSVDLCALLAYVHIAYGRRMRAICQHHANVNVEIKINSVRMEQFYVVLLQYIHKHQPLNCV